MMHPDALLLLTQRGTTKPRVLIPHVQFPRIAQATSLEPWRTTRPFPPNDRDSEQVPEQVASGPLRPTEQVSGPMNAALQYLLPATATRNNPYRSTPVTARPARDTATAVKRRAPEKTSLRRSRPPQQDAR